MHAELLGSEKVVTVSTTGNVLVSANPRRRSLVISAPTTNRITITAQGNPVIDQGLTIQPKTDVTILTYEDVGNWLCSNLMCISVVAAETVGVVEGLLP